MTEQERETIKSELREELLAEMARPKSPKICKYYGIRVHLDRALTERALDVQAANHLKTACYTILKMHLGVKRMEQIKKEQIPEAKALIDRILAMIPKEEGQ